MNSESESHYGSLEELAPTREKVSAREAIKTVIGPNGEINASTDILFGGSVFGRDSVESAEDSMKTDPTITEGAIVSLAELQGTTYDIDTEEEPGRIHHEFRSLLIDGKKVPEESEAIINMLAEKKWGTPEQIHYFGTVDATPLYVRLVMEYVTRNGQDAPDLAFLDREITQKNGETKTIRDSVYAGLSWIENRMQQSPLGLIEFKRTNPQGIENQVWKDSDTSYVHTNGMLANHNDLIAPIEVQGYAYDAFMKARDLIGTTEDKKRWQEKASHLQSALDQLWIPDEQFFAMGIDRDAEKNPRLIQTISTNPALLLDTEIFDTIPEPKKSTYINGIVKRITGDGFLTEVGIRTRDVKYAQLIPHPYEPDQYLSDYHGSETSWVKETYDIAKGLHRQGFHRLAEQLENRILNATNTSGKFYEFYYVNEAGEVNYDPKNTSDVADARKKLSGTNIPEGTQAWTIAAVLDIKRKRGEKSNVDINTQSPQYQLEESILKSIPKVEVIRHFRDIKKIPVPFVVEKIKQVNPPPELITA